MCHTLQITGAAIDFDINRESHSITAICSVRVNGQTGVEMEALTGASVALLTIYDMCKAVTKEMTISGIMLVEKTGGKSDYIGADLLVEEEEKREARKKTEQITGIFQGGKK
jgi:cyclic pyranopterin phosphate synthase